MEIKGDKEFIKKLQSLRKTVAAKAVRKGSRAASKIQAVVVKSSVPRVSGQTYSQIKVRALPRSRRWIGTQVRLGVGTGPAYYAAFVELGTVRQRAQSNLRHAASETEGEASEVFIRAVLVEIEKL